MNKVFIFADRQSFSERFLPSNALVKRGVEGVD
jgi:hypothetical protein